MELSAIWEVGLGGGGEGGGTAYTLGNIILVN